MEKGVELESNDNNPKKTIPKTEILKKKRKKPNQKRNKARKKKEKRKKKKATKRNKAFVVGGDGVWLGGMVMEWSVADMVFVCTSSRT
eukprot:m.20673 g.20673  ORF g.20673 m.20673 type:complete len:88 (-) comp13046_c0_seq1:218-481(-)